MRRAAGLFEPIVDWDNLREATCRAARGKRHRADTQAFLADIDRNLELMADRLRAGTFEVGRFHQFLIHDPKERIITAPVFSERVLHHAIMNVCEPHFERWSIDDSFACRRGKGRIAALTRARGFQARYSWCVHVDIRKYFDSIDHGRILELLGRRFKDRRLLDLWRRIVVGYRGAAGRGLPIGSLTSQHFANFYLGWFDRFVKERLRVPGYVRYMDDMLLWSSDRGELFGALEASGTFLTRELGLALRPEAKVRATRLGADFLGCRVFREYMILNRRSRRRFVRKIEALEQAFECAAIGERELQDRATSLIAFTRTDGVSSWKLRRRVLETSSVSGR